MHEKKSTESIGNHVFRFSGFQCKIAFDLWLVKCATQTQWPYTITQTGAHCDYDTVVRGLLFRIIVFMSFSKDTLINKANT